MYYVITSEDDEAKTLNCPLKTENFDEAFNYVLNDYYEGDKEQMDYEQVDAPQCFWEHNCKSIQIIEIDTSFCLVLVDWDTDGEEVADLDTLIAIPKDLEEEEVADYLSDEYGWCVESWEYFNN